MRLNIYIWIVYTSLEFRVRKYIEGAINVDTEVSIILTLVIYHVQIRAASPPSRMQSLEICCSHLVPVILLPGI